MHAGRRFGFSAAKSLDGFQTCLSRFHSQVAAGEFLVAMFLRANLGGWFPASEHPGPRRSPRHRGTFTRVKGQRQEQAGSRRRSRRCTQRKGAPGGKFKRAHDSQSVTCTGRGPCGRVRTTEALSMQAPPLPPLRLIIWIHFPRTIQVCECRKLSQS